MINKIKQQQIFNVKKVIDTEFRTSKKDIYLNKLKKEFSTLSQYNYCIPLTSATAALHTALKAIKISKNDEVIMSSLTMSAPLQAILACGGKAVFCDIDENSFNISMNDLLKKISKKTKAIIIVNLFGLPIDYKILKKNLSKINKKIFIIEDNAECIFGPKINSRLIKEKSFIDFSLYSFQSSKIIKSGEGGMLCTNNEKLANAARHFSNLGYQISNRSYKKNRELLKKTNFNRHYAIGINYRMPELCAAVIIPQIKNINKILHYRLLCGQKFNEVLLNYPRILSQNKNNKLQHSYWAYPILFDNFLTYQKFVFKFRKFGGDNFYGAWKVPYKEPFYKKFYNKKYDKCLIAEKIQKRLIQLNTSYTNINKINQQAKALDLTLKNVFK
jgi:perosamine synthetase